MSATRNAISTSAIVAMLVLSASGCTTSGGSKMGLFTATAPVITLMVDDFFVGTAVGYMDRTGTIDMTSTTRPDVRCVGEFRYTGMRTGTATLRCSDGLVAEVNFNALSSLSGYGYGTTSRGPASFTYGLKASEALKYLRFPEGMEADLSGEKPVTRPKRDKNNTSA